MTDTLSRIVGPVNVALGTSTVFTGTAAHIYTIKHIRVVNGTGGSITLKLGIGGVADANLILPATALGLGESCEFDGLLVLAGAETLQANASATGLTVTVAGLDQVA